MELNTELNIDINIKSVDKDGKWTTAIDAPERAKIVSLIAIFEACTKQMYEMAEEKNIPKELFSITEFQDIGQ